MASGCGWSLFCFASSADRNAALTAVPIAANEDLFTGNGIAGTGTSLYVREDGWLQGIGVTSETAAAVEWRARTTNQSDYIRSDRFTRLQTAAYAGGPSFCRVKYGLKKGESLTADLQNGGAVLDSINCIISEGKEVQLKEWDAPELPPGVIAATFTATMTHVADSWSPIGQCVFDNYVLDTTKKYKIVGMSAFSATGCAHRLRFYSGPDKANAPGVNGGDTAPISNVVFGDFGTFEGLTGVGIQTIAVAADATTSGTLWIVEA